MWAISDVYNFCVKTEEAVTSLLKRELGAVNTRLASNTFMVGHSVEVGRVWFELPSPSQRKLIES